MDTVDCMQSLECLQLSCSIHDLQPTSMNPFTRNQLPQLRNIRLEKIHFPWSSSVYSCLHELSISCVNPGPSAPELMRMLHHCPDLCSLQIDNLWETTLPPSTASLEVDNSSPVHLPKLQLLAIADTYSRADFICKRTVVPSTCIISIKFANEDPSSDGIVLLAPTSSSSNLCYRPART